MATRFYLPSSGAAAVNPAFSAWTQTTSAARIAAVTTKSNTALTNVAIAETLNGNANILVRQYVSATLPYAKTIDGQVQGVIRVLESATQANMESQITIKVVSGDGLTLRGTLYALEATVSGLEWGIAAETRYFPANVSGTLTPVNAQVGDRIVIEVGYFCSSNTTSRTGTMRFGDPSATADFAASAGLTTDLCPWIEFSADIFTAPTALLAGSISVAVTVAGDISHGHALAGSSAAAVTTSGDLSVTTGSTELLEGAVATTVSVTGALGLYTPTANGDKWRSVAQIPFNPDGSLDELDHKHYAEYYRDFAVDTTQLLAGVVGISVVVVGNLSVSGDALIGQVWRSIAKIPPAPDNDITIEDSRHYASYYRDNFTADEQLLAGSIAVVLTAAANLSHEYHLAGGISISLSKTGAIAHSYSLSGAITAALTTTGDISHSHSLAGSVSLSVTQAGDISTTHDLAGAILVSSAVVGNISHSYELAGSIAAVVTATGIIGADLVLLAGDINIATSLAGNISHAQELSTAVLAGLTATGDISHSHTVSGNAAVSVIVAGDLTIAGDSTLAGSSNVAVTAVGALSHAFALAGSAASAVSVSGNLSVTEVFALAGTCSASLIATGDLFIEEEPPIFGSGGGDSVPIRYIRRD